MGIPRWMCTLCIVFFFFFNDTATTEIYTLSLHDALPILGRMLAKGQGRHLYHRHYQRPVLREAYPRADEVDRKSTRLNSSHPSISYAVFCLKKKKHTHHAYTVRPSSLSDSRRAQRTK